MLRAPERAGQHTRVLVALQRGRHAALHELPFGAVVRQRRRDQVIQVALVAFTRQHGDEAPRGRHDSQRGPRVDAQRAPHDLAGVVEHRVRDAVAQHGGADGGVVALCRELGRVHANDGHGQVDILGLQGGQLRQHVHAVDAAQRPEVEHQDAAAQLARQRERRRVKPSASRKVGQLCAGAAVLVRHEAQVGGGAIRRRRRRGGERGAGRSSER
jgi:hypothetical protein